MNSKKQFFFNGFLLTAVSLLMRTVGVSFNVYISNRVGAEAMGLFSLISTVLGFALTLATSGIGFATTKLLSAALAPQHTAPSAPYRKTPRTNRILRHCLLYATAFSIPVSLLLYFLSPTIGLYWLRDTRAISSLRLLSLTLFPVAISSVLSGYFSAMRRVWKNAATSLTEQFFKILCCSFLLSAHFAHDVESACLCVVGGGVIAELLSCGLQILLYAAEKRALDAQASPPDTHKADRASLLRTALPIAFSAYLRSGLITLEHILIPHGLEKSGADRAHALAAYGTVQSMVFPVIFFPSALLSSFASLLIPEVSEAHAAQDHRRILRIVRRVVETALFFSIGVAGIIRCFSGEIGDVLYPTTEAGAYIRMLAPLIPIMYLDTATDAILKGMGEQVYSMCVNIADALISVVLVWWLLPHYGIMGYVLTVYVTESFNTVLSVYRLLQIVPLRPTLFRWLIQPLVCIILSTSLCCWLPVPLSSPAFATVSSLLFHLLLSCGIYLLLLFAFQRRTSRPRQKKTNR